MILLTNEENKIHCEQKGLLYMQKKDSVLMMMTRKNNLK